eukprot:3860619-Amphidinium_carterae.1
MFASVLVLKSEVFLETGAAEVTLGGAIGAGAMGPVIVQTTVCHPLARNFAACASRLQERLHSAI